MNAKQVIAVSALALLGANTAFAQEASSDAWMKVASTKSRAEVQAEVAATDLDGMLREGRALAKIAKNVTVKVPLTWEGLKACRTLSALAASPPYVAGSNGPPLAKIRSTCS